MGIRNINMLSEKQYAKLASEAKEKLEAKLAAEHRRGEHGDAVRRECPLCSEI